jgi:hypothetical protein
MERINLENYKQVYQTLRLSQKLIDIAEGTVKLPSNFCLQPPRADHGFPPAFIPLWSELSNSLSHGVWKHWFASGREISYVCLDAEAYYASEVARTPEQLLAFIVFKELLTDHEIVEELKSFAGKVGMSNFDEVHQAFLLTKDSGMCNLINVSNFGTLSPLECHLNYFGFNDLPAGTTKDGFGYMGTYPHVNMSLTPDSVRRVCGLEITDGLLEKIAALPFAPPWLSNVVKKSNSPLWVTTYDQAPIFYQLLEANDFAGAWMSLNSSGWEFAEAKKAMKDLANKVQDIAFSTLAVAWCEEPHEKFASSY